MKINKSIFKLISLALIQAFILCNVSSPGFSYRDKTEEFCLSPSLHIDVNAVKGTFSLLCNNSGKYQKLISFTPLEKAADGAGGEYQEDDGGSKPPSSIIVRERSSLTGFTPTYDGILGWLENVTRILGKRKLIVFDYHVDCDTEVPPDSSWLWEKTKK